MLKNWLTVLSAKTDTKVKDDEVFVRVCPFCGNDSWNLQINLKKQVWHCWACGKGKEQTLSALLRYYNIKFFGHKVLNNLITNNEVVQKEAETIQKKLLYEKAAELQSSNTLAARTIKAYLTTRSITDFSGILYTLNHVVVPMYQRGELVYYVKRQIFGKMYQNPKLSKTNFLATFGKGLDGILCEGVFDALTIRELGYTAMPLLGKFISEKQVRILKRYNFRQVIICLDADANEAAIDMFFYLQYNKIPVKLATLKTGDPNSEKDKLKSVLEQATNKLNFAHKLDLLNKNKKTKHSTNWFYQCNNTIGEK